MKNHYVNAVHALMQALRDYSIDDIDDADKALRDAQLAINAWRVEIALGTYANRQRERDALVPPGER